jgi:hypothetical protein
VWAHMTRCLFGPASTQLGIAARIGDRGCSYTVQKTWAPCVQMSFETIVLFSRLIKLFMFLKYVNRAAVITSVRNPS